MATLFFGMNQSLDGYVDHDAFETGPALFAHFTEMVRGLAGSVYGRRLYEVMRYWDADDASWTPALRDFAEAWRAQPKFVVSRTLKDVGPNATLIAGDVAAAVGKLKAELTGEVQVGGPALAQSLGETGLIDEYRIYLRPYVVGSGRPFFAGPRPKLRFVRSDLIGEDAVRLIYAPV